MTEVVTRIPEARVVSPLAPAKPRRVPGLAAIYMIGPAIAGVIATLVIGFFCCGVLTSGKYGSPQLFDAHTEDSISTLGFEWGACAVLVLVLAALYQRRFLRRAHVIEGVIHRGEIVITLENHEYRIDSVTPEASNGTRVPLFWRGSRVVELSKAGAALTGAGEVSWDAKPYRYGWAATWPLTVLAIVVTAVAMLVMLGITFL